MKKNVGILALQGDFEAHSKALERAGAEPVLVRTAEDLKSIDGLVIPGGESTTMLKLLNFMELGEPLMSSPERSRCSGPARAHPAGEGSAEPGAGELRRHRHDRGTQRLRAADR